MLERRDVLIRPPVAEFGARAPRVEVLVHQCPICFETFPAETILTHGRECVEKNPERVREIMNES